LKEWTTPDFRNAPSTTNLEEDEIADALGNDGNASMPEQINRLNPWRRRRMMIMMMIYRCPRRNVPNFGRMFLMLKYTDITQNTYIQG
jgi:hypothetical protein